MELFKTVYSKESKIDMFLIDLMKYLKGKNNFYKINDIVVEETETEKKYTTSILFLTKAQEKKKYILSKKTDDSDQQIPTDAVEETESKPESKPEKEVIK